MGVVVVTPWVDLPMVLVANNRSSFVLRKLELKAHSQLFVLYAMPSHPFESAARDATCDGGVLPLIPPLAECGNVNAACLVHLEEHGTIKTLDKGVWRST